MNNDGEIIPSGTLRAIIFAGGVLLAGYAAYVFWRRAKSAEPASTGVKVVSVPIDLPVKKAAKKKK